MKQLFLIFALAVLPLSVYAATADKELKAQIGKCESKYKSDKTKKTDCIKKVKKAAKNTDKASANKANIDKKAESAKSDLSKADKSKSDKVKAATASSVTTKKALKAVNVNSASAKQLAESLPGVGDKKAQAIIDYRKKNGKFKSAADLEKVPGLGQKSVAGMKKYLKF
ncbi:ComEA family DNA-binding protein [Photobacterium sanguinicancri]|uniref:Competence protein ComEA n=1 Tax=Photobacterium sanguinicancri TaxID=875932 RepID=A0ABX4G0W5_9GAMM|nr:helix-hairpin-helix domain-containing protein [Photobacterium sanguinicancri]OZS44793.1 competence protein ComEA [Photobacterium sanguinicancri]